MIGLFQIKRFSKHGKVLLFILYIILISIVISAFRFIAIAWTPYGRPKNGHLYLLIITLNLIIFTITTFTKEIPLPLYKNGYCYHHKIYVLLSF